MRTLIIILLLLMVLAVSPAHCRSNTADINVWELQQQSTLLNYKIYANDKILCVATEWARLVAKAPKWEVYAFNIKDHTICQANYDKFVSNYKPDRTIDDVRKTAFKCGRLGTPGLLFVYADHSEALSDGETGLAFREHMKTKRMARKGFVFAADDHGVAKEAKDILRCFQEIRTQYALPLEIYDEFADGQRVYKLKTLSQRQAKLDPAMLEIPRGYKPGSSVHFEFFSNVVNGVGELMAP